MLELDTVAAVHFFHVFTYSFNIYSVSAKYSVPAKYLKYIKKTKNRTKKTFQRDFFLEHRKKNKTIFLGSIGRELNVKPLYS